jgi:hypothetical protein
VAQAGTRTGLASAAEGARSSPGPLNAVRSPGQPTAGAPSANDLAATPFGLTCCVTSCGTGDREPVERAYAKRRAVNTNPWGARASKTRQARRRGGTHRGNAGQRRRVQRRGGVPAHGGRVVCWRGWADRPPSPPCHTRGARHAGPTRRGAQQSEQDSRSRRGQLGGERLGEGSREWSACHGVTKAVAGAGIHFKQTDIISVAANPTAAVPHPQPGARLPHRRREPRWHLGRHPPSALRTARRDADARCYCRCCWALHPPG